MPEAPGGRYGFFAISRSDTPPGPAASWLLDQFTDPAQWDHDAIGFANV
jgi:hypothetical protein